MTCLPPFSGERVIPWRMNGRPDLMRDHAMRYCFFLGLSAGRRVVDLGCGVGYGSYLMSWTADAVLGVDSDEETVQLAQALFGSVARFRVMDLEAVDVLPLSSLYVAFEVLEHLDDPARLLAMVGDKPIVWSLPVDSPSGYHKHVYTIEQAEAFVSGSRFWYQCGNGVFVPEGESIPGGYTAKYVVGGRW